MHLHNVIAGGINGITYIYFFLLIYSAVYCPIWFISKVIDRQKKYILYPLSFRLSILQCSKLAVARQPEAARKTTPTWFLAKRAFFSTLKQQNRTIVRYNYHFKAAYLSQTLELFKHLLHTMTGVQITFFFSVCRVYTSRWNKE